MFTSNNPPHNSLPATFYKWGNWGPGKWRECLQVGSTICGLCDIILILYVFVTQEPGECGETFIYFSHGVSYQIIPHSPGQIDRSSISILAPCLFTISFFLSTRSPQSFLAPGFPLGSHLYLGWAIKDLSSLIHLWRKLWVLQILQNKTVPNKLFSADWFSNLKA